MNWEIDVVERLHVGRDRISRSADLRTAKGKTTRAVQRLFNLELVNESENVVDPIEASNTTANQNTDQLVDVELPKNRTRPERLTRKPAKYQDFVCNMKY